MATLEEKKDELVFWKTERKNLAGKKELAKGRGGSEFLAKWDLPHIQKQITILEDSIAVIEFNASSHRGCHA